MKILTWPEDTRAKLLSGMTKVATMVLATMWPKGKNILIEKEFWAPTSTNDGVSVAREIELKDRIENMGASIIKEATEKTNKEVGDSTTTTTALLLSMVEKGFKVLWSGVNPFVLIEGMHSAKEEVINTIKNLAIKVETTEDIRNIATISAQDSEVGNIIAEIVEEIGHDGVISVEENKTAMGLTKEVVSGMSFDWGYDSPYYVTDQNRMEAVIENPLILITDQTIYTIKDIIGIVNAMEAVKVKDLVIIAEDVKQDVASSLILNKMQGNINVVTIKAPWYGENKEKFLGDLAIATGGTLISSILNHKLEETTLDMLGIAKKVIVTKDRTIIKEGNGSAELIEARITEINEQLPKADTEYKKNSLLSRKARLAGGIGIIKIGASTDIEMKNKKFKIEDAIAATRASIQEGIVAGWGTLFTKIINVVDIDKSEDFNKGRKIVFDSLGTPLYVIATNAWYKGDEVIAKVRDNIDNNQGFDAKNWIYTDMVVAGIIDPAKWLRLALENAVSAAAMVISTGGSIIDGDSI